MKKLLLCSFFVLALCLTGCNNNTTKDNTNNNNQSQNQNQNQDQTSQENSNTVIYDSPDFSKTAGFKIVLDDSLKDVKYDSIFLINDSIAQLDLEFPDKTIGTILVDPTESSHLFNPSDAVFVGDTKVSIEIGADGIILYEWQKDNYTFVYHTKNDLKDSDVLKNLVNGISVEITR